MLSKPLVSVLRRLSEVAVLITSYKPKNLRVSQRWLLCWGKPMDPILEQDIPRLR